MHQDILQVTNYRHNLGDPKLSAIADGNKLVVVDQCAIAKLQAANFVLDLSSAL